MNEPSEKQIRPLWLTDGTAREDRLKGLPAPFGLKVDADGLMERLARAHAFAGQLAFFGPDNKEKGTWEGMFLSDPSALLAVIAGAPVHEREAGVRGYLHPCGGERGWRLAAQIYALAELLNHWYGLLLACRGEAAFALLHTLSGLIKERLARGLAELQLTELRLRRELPSREPLVIAEAFHRIWDLENRALEQLKAGKTTQAVVAPALFHLFYNAALQVQTEARRHFPSSLETGEHDPAMGLFMAYLTLYQHGADALNTLPKRHRDLYYDGVLSMAAIPGGAGKVFLHLLPDDRKPQVTIPARTAFSGGKESLGQDTVARLVSPVTVHQGEITRLETLLCRRHPLISPEGELGLISGLHHGVRTLNPAIPEGGVTAGESWPLFGHAHERAEDATLGFAVSAPIFAMAEGERRIQVTLEHAPLARKAETLLEETLACLAKSRKEGRKGAMRTLFAKAFCFAISTTQGWHEVPDATLAVTLVNGAPRFIARLSLGREVPAVAGWDPEIHGTPQPGEPGTPLLRVTVNPLSPVHLTSLLTRFVLRRITLRVAVRGARNLTLANQLGPLDPNTPFAPFGPLPKQGAYWVLGHGESAGKQVKACSFRLFWADLPATSQGFTEHYRAYDAGIENTSFGVSVSALKEGVWVAEPQGPIRPLFSDEPGKGRRPAGVTRLSVSDDKLLGATSGEITPGGYSPASRNGFFKITLATPGMAFGHHIYPELLTRRLMLQAKVKKGVELPKAPYTPMINAVEMDYDAVTTLVPHGDKAQGRFFHLLPSGFREPGWGDPVSLIADLQGEAHLFLGIEGGAPKGRVNLLFCLEEGGAMPGEHPDIAITWAVLQKNGWQPLMPADVLNDGTGGLITTGVITLNLPQAPRMGHTQMPDGFLWLRATASLVEEEARCGALQHALTAHLARCRGVYLNGALAHLEDVDADPPDGTPYKPLSPLPGIRSVVQAMVPIGRRAHEDAPQRMARIRERLKHKARGVTPWDLERLLLEQEPGLRKVKCFPAMDARGTPRPGHCLVAVLPEKGAGEEPPRLSAHRLTALRQALEARATGHARFQVINPAYERIQVRCTLTLTSSGGEALGRVHAAIHDFLSPWVAEVGYGPRFGWCVREAEVRAHIAAHPDVLSVTNFSMLHLIREPDGRYLLKDTALKGAAEPRDEGEDPCRGTDGPAPALTRKEIHPHLPWSIAIPAGAHYLEVSDTATSIAPEKTGIGELEVGRTLIL